MKPLQDPFSEEIYSSGSKERRVKLSQYDLDDLRELLDANSFNLGKVYQHAKDRSRKRSIRNSFRKRINHTS